MILSSERILVAVAITLERFVIRLLLEIHNKHLKATVFLNVAHRI